MELSTAQSKSWMRRKTLKVNSGEARARSPSSAQCYSVASASLDLKIKTSMFMK